MDSENDVDVVPIRLDGDGVELDEYIERKRLKREVEALFKHSRKGESKKTLFFIVKRRTKEVLHDIIKNNVARGTTSTLTSVVVMNGFKMKGTPTKPSTTREGFPG